MKDNLEVLNAFATEVVDALNEFGVQPPNDEHRFGALLVMVANENNHGEPPVGASLNFEEGRWQVTPQAQEATPCNEDGSSVVVTGMHEDDEDGHF